MSARTTPDPDLNTPAVETLAQRVERDCENRSKHSRYMAEHEFERAVTEHVDHLRGQVEKLMTDRMTGPQVHDKKGGGRYVTISQHHPLRPFTDNVTARLKVLEETCDLLRKKIDEDVDAAVSNNSQGIHDLEERMKEREEEARSEGATHRENRLANLEHAFYHHSGVPDRRYARSSDFERLEKEVRGLTGRTEPVPDGYTMVTTSELRALTKDAEAARRFLNEKYGGGQPSDVAERASKKG